MEDPRKSHKKYKRPKKPFEKERIDEEKKIKERYGLKNKREIWKAKEEINKIRRQAKQLISGSDEGKERFMARLIRLGLISKEASIDEILGLTEKDWLERRLQTIVAKKKLANSAKQARQLIVHKKIKVKGKIVNVPSYIVRKEEEETIKSIMPIKDIKKLSKQEKELLTKIKEKKQKENGREEREKEE